MSFTTDRFYMFKKMFETAASTFKAAQRMPSPPRQQQQQRAAPTPFASSPARPSPAVSNGTLAKISRYYVKRLDSYKPGETAARKFILINYHNDKLPQDLKEMSKTNPAFNVYYSRVFDRILMMRESALRKDVLSRILDEEASKLFTNVTVEESESEPDDDSDEPGHVRPFRYASRYDLLMAEKFRINNESVIRQMISPMMKKINKRSVFTSPEMHEYRCLIWEYLNAFLDTTRGDPMDSLNLMKKLSAYVDQRVEKVEAEKREKKKANRGVA